MSVALDTDAALARHGADAIAKGSKSFAFASLLFGRDMQADVHMLYAWCRHCDDVIDGQTFGGDAPGAMPKREREARLQMLREQTRKALRGERTGDPAFDGFGAVAARRGIPECYAMDLLDGFALDVEARNYATLDELMTYCYGVAGVVGVMMAIVMGVDAQDDETLDRACDLGLAFQLTNICRDVIDDAKGGRIYLPLDWLAAEGVAGQAEALLEPVNREALSCVAAKTLSAAERYYNSASVGARRLPLRAAAAVLAARNVYRAIGRKVRDRGSQAWDDRAFTSKPQKIALALAGAGDALAQQSFLRNRPLETRDDLWRRPRRKG